MCGIRQRSWRHLALALLLPLGGCVVVAVAAGAAAVYGVIKYTQNGAQQDFEADLGATWDAVIASLRELGYAVEGDPRHGATEGTIRTGDVSVRVVRHPGDFTRIEVRVGTFETEDHKRRAGLILEAVARRLDDSG